VNSSLELLIGKKPIILSSTKVLENECKHAGTSGRDFQRFALELCMKNSIFMAHHIYKGPTSMKAEVNFEKQITA